MSTTSFYAELLNLRIKRGILTPPLQILNISIQLLCRVKIHKNKKVALFDGSNTAFL